MIKEIDWGKTIDNIKSKDIQKDSTIVESEVEENEFISGEDFVKGFNTMLETKYKDCVVYK